MLDLYICCHDIYQTPPAIIRQVIIAAKEKELVSTSSYIKESRQVWRIRPPPNRVSAPANWHVTGKIPRNRVDKAYIWTGRTTFRTLP